MSAALHEYCTYSIFQAYLLSCQLMDSKLDFCKTTLVRIQEIMLSDVVMAVQVCIYTTYTAKAAPRNDITTWTCKTDNGNNYDHRAWFLRVIMLSLHSLSCLPSVKKQKHDFIFFFFFCSMCNKTILDLVSVIIQNNQGPQPHPAIVYL